MNSTGVKLNLAEVRNAEYYGVFKLLADKLAYEHEDLWRAWRVVTNNDIARMLDIELAADAIIAMINGVSERDEKTFDHIYTKYEDSFPQKAEVAKRFRAVINTIGSHFGADNVGALFKGRTMFYALFITVYHLQYKLKVTVHTVASRDGAVSLRSLACTAWVSQSNTLRSCRRQVSITVNSRSTNRLPAADCVPNDSFRQITA